MKKIYVLLLAMAAGITGFAQKSSQRHIVAGNAVQHSAARTTAFGDTISLTNTAGDNIVLYSAGTDSGYLAGTNYWGDQGFAERYDFNGSDSTYKVIGAMMKFGGKVSSSSSKNITFNLWGISAPRYITAGLSYSGFPSSSVLSHTMPLTQLTPGTMQTVMFNNVAATLGSFYFGYNIDYNFTSLNGDTVGLYTSEDGDRNSVAQYLNVTISGADTTIDTVINVQNATQWSDGTWHDNYTDNDSLFNDLAIYPIVEVWHPNSVKGISRKDLTFYSCYPNPATNETNVKILLAAQTDVTIQVMDLSGRVMSITIAHQLAQGEHSIAVNTSALAAGEYIFLIRTAEGDGIASKVAVVK